MLSSYGNTPACRMLIALTTAQVFFVCLLAVTSVKKNPNMHGVRMSRPSPCAGPRTLTQGFVEYHLSHARHGASFPVKWYSEIRLLLRLSVISPRFYPSEQFKAFHYTEVAQGVNLHINCSLEGTLPSARLEQMISYVKPPRCSGYNNNLAGRNQRQRQRPIYVPFIQILIKYNGVFPLNSKLFPNLSQF